mgnify:CR=1 FL=1
MGPRRTRLHKDRSGGSEKGGSGDPPPHDLPFSLWGQASRPVPFSKQQVELPGKLVVEEGQSPSIVSQGKSIPVVSRRGSISATLQDARLSGKEFKLLGNFREDGSFEVDDFFVVRRGTLYRLVYFCDTCNITTFSPGECACCRQPTVPIEVPLNDPRVYYEEIKAPAKKP